MVYVEAIFWDIVKHLGAIYAQPFWQLPDSPLTVASEAEAEACSIDANGPVFDCAQRNRDHG